MHISSKRPTGNTFIVIFLFAVFMYWLGLYLYVPTLPLYLQTKTTDLALVGSVLSMYGLWQIVSRFPMGVLSDWVGHRKFIIFACCVVLAAGDFLLGRSANIQTATLGRALVGIAAGCWVPLVVMFSGFFGPQEIVRSTAILSMVGFWGRIVATAANGWLNRLGGYPLAFQLAAGAALLGSLLFLLVPESKGSEKPPSPKQIIRLFRRRDVMLPTLLQANLHIAEFVATYTFTPILAHQKGASDIAVSLMISMSLGVALAGSYLSPRLAARFGARWVIGLCFTFETISLAGLALAPNLVLVFLFQWCTGFAMGVGYPLLMGKAIEQVEAASRNSAMGLHQSIYSIGMFIGPWIGGQLVNWVGMSAMFKIFAGLMLPIAIWAAILARSQLQPTSHAIKPPG